MKLPARAILLLTGLILTLGAQAQTAPNTTPYPERPVKIIVPFPPGGTNDIIGRLVAKHLESAFGQSFVVENKAGAGGVIGTESASKARSDGYTLLVSSSAPMATALALYKDRISYDALKDFVPIATLIDVTVVVTTNLKFPATDIQSLIRIAKKDPGQVRAGLPAVGGMQHLLTAVFEADNGVKFNMIPYKGSAPTVVDLLGGHIDVDFDNMPAVLEHIKSGRLRGLAVSTPNRSEMLPDVPSFKELGMNNLLAAPWFILVAPKGTPAPIVAKLNAEVKRMFETPEAQAALKRIGANSAWRSQKESTKFLADEIVRWKKIVDKTKIEIS
jgi:tripartite-type tricarboxylate transporter receptor subunit TctC